MPDGYARGDRASPDFYVVVITPPDPKAGACDSLFEITSDPRLNHRCQVVSGVLADDCARILGEFFQAKRRLGKK